MYFRITCQLFILSYLDAKVAFVYYWLGNFE